MAAAAAGEPASPCTATASQTRDFVYVGDVVAAITRALRRPAAGVAVANVGSGVATSVLDVLGTLETLAGHPIPREHTPPRGGDIRHSRADTGRARWVLGWEAGATFADGMAATWEWYRGRS